MLTLVLPCLQACIERIERRGEGTCEPQYMEWLKCIDKHVSIMSAKPYVVHFNFLFAFWHDGVS